MLPGKDGRTGTSTMANTVAFSSPRSTMASWQKFFFVSFFFFLTSNDWHLPKDVWMFQRTNTTWLSFCNHIKISYLEWQFLTGSLFIKRWLELQKKQKTRSSYVCTIFSILWQKETCTPFDIQNKNKKNRNFLSLYGENCVFCWHMWTKTKYRLNNELNQISHTEK